MSQSLILVSNRPDDLVFAKTVAEIAGLDFVQTVDLMEITNAIKEQDVGAILVDFVNEQGFRTFEAAIHDQVGLFSDRLNANRFHYLSDLDLEERKFLCESPIFGNFA